MDTAEKHWKKSSKSTHHQRNRTNNNNKNNKNNNNNNNHSNNHSNNKTHPMTAFHFDPTPKSHSYQEESAINSNEHSKKQAAMHFSQQAANYRASFAPRISPRQIH